MKQRMRFERISCETTKAIDKLGYRPDVLLLAFHQADGKLVWGYVYLKSPIVKGTRQ